METILFSCVIMGITLQCTRTEECLNENEYRIAGKQSVAKINIKYTAAMIDVTMFLLCVIQLTLFIHGMLLGRNFHFNLFSRAENRNIFV